MGPSPDSLDHFDTVEGLAWANAIERDDLARLRAIAAEGRDVNAASGTGATPLDWAFQTGRKPAFATLLDLGARPGVDLVEASITHGDPDYLRLLCGHGLDPNGKNHLGEPMVFTAILAGQRRAIRLLVERGADVNATRTDGLTPLIALASLGAFEDAFWFIERGADPMAATQTGATLASRAQEARPTLEQEPWRDRVIHVLESRGVVFPVTPPSRR